MHRCLLCSHGRSCKKVKVDADPRGHDPTWDPHSVLDTGKHAADYANAYFGRPEDTFKRAGKMPDFRGRLLPFWQWPWTIDGEVFGAVGLKDQALFPYREYRMLGGVPFERVDVK